MACLVCQRIYPVHALLYGFMFYTKPSRLFLMYIIVLDTALELSSQNYDV